MKPKVKNWIAQLQNGVIKSKTTKVLYQIHYHTFRGRGYTNVDELRTQLGMPHQTLTAILSNVQDEGLIKTYGEIKVNDSLFQKISYAMADERNALILQRSREKYVHWVKRGKEEFSKFMPQNLLSELNKIH
jgi:predicted transcriptional regulator